MSTQLTKDEVQQFVSVKTEAAGDLRIAYYDAGGGGRRGG